MQVAEGSFLDSLSCPKFVPYSHKNNTQIQSRWFFGEDLYERFNVSNKDGFSFFGGAP